MLERTLKEVGYYLIFVTSIAVPLVILWRIDTYFWGVTNPDNAGPIGIFLSILSMPFVITAIILTAILEGNPHSGGSEQRFYGIVLFEILLFLAGIWTFCRWAYLSGSGENKK